MESLNQSPRYPHFEKVLTNGELHSSPYTFSNAAGARFMFGTPCRTQTCDLLIRSQTLYSTELRVHAGLKSKFSNTDLQPR